MAVSQGWRLWPPENGPLGPLGSRQASLGFNESRLQRGLQDRWNLGSVPRRSQNLGRWPDKVLSLEPCYSEGLEQEDPKPAGLF